MVPRNQLKKSYFYNAAYTFFINERRKVNMLNSADKTAKKSHVGVRGWSNSTTEPEEP